MGWRLEKRGHKLEIIYKWELPGDPGYGNGIQFRDKGDFEMLEFLAEELIQQNAYTMDSYTITVWQDKLSYIVHKKLGERYDGFVWK